MQALQREEKNELDDTDKKKNVKLQSPLTIQDIETYLVQ